MNNDYNYRPRGQGRELQNHLGVQPGDNIILEISGNEWIIKAAKTKAELCRAGDLPDDAKQASLTASEDAELLEDTWRIQISPREVRTVLAQVVSSGRT